MEYLVLVWDPYIFIDLKVEKSFFFLLFTASHNIFKFWKPVRQKNVFGYSSLKTIFVLFVFHNKNEPSTFNKNSRFSCQRISRFSYNLILIIKNWQDAKPLGRKERKSNITISVQFTRGWPNFARLPNPSSYLKLMSDLPLSICENMRYISPSRKWCFLTVSGKREKKIDADIFKIDATGTTKDWFNEKKFYQTRPTKFSSTLE